MDDAALQSKTQSKREQVIERPDGARLLTVSAGQGPTVVLAHGYLLDHTVYQGVFDRLVRTGHRAIAFDQRGHGRSSVGSEGVSPAALADDYKALLESYQVQSGTLVAHSMGAFLALTLCLREPEFVPRALRRLVLLGPNAGAVGVGSLQNRLQAPLLKAGVIPPLWRFPPAGRALTRSLFGAHPDRASVERTRAILARQRVELTLPMLEAMLHEDLYPRLREISLETFVLAGELDRTCPRWHAARIGSELRRARNIWLPNKGHMLPFEAPEAILDAVTAPTLPAR